MRDWLQPAVEALARDEAAMLVHLVELKGSGPREVGAQMLVTENAVFDTIGGGEFERTSTLRARELLQSGGAGLLRLALGPELNQCCGGFVTVAFEPFATADLAWLKKLIRAAEDPTPIFRTVQLDDMGNLRRDWVIGGEGPEFAATLTSPLRGGRNLQAERSRFREGAATPTPYGAEKDGLEVLAVDIREQINPQPQAFWLFGAGHVGRAVAYAIAPLGFALTWVDARADQFPEPRPAGVKCLALAMPELAVDEAPPDTVFAVMTHSHPLDEAICEAVLRRADFAYLGLIGSTTKRARFVKRLGEAGISPKQLERLTCPIGLAAIESKEPAAIAASFAADLLLRRERNLLRADAAALNG